MIGFRQLRNALALAEHRNFGRAAKILNISQPALSRSIQQMEDTAGEKLFNRNKREIRPTHLGEIVLKHARLIIASTNSMHEDIRMHKGLLKGGLNIGSGPYASGALLARAIGEFIDQYPDLNVNISVDDWNILPGRLLQNEFDFVIMETSKLDLTNDIELIHLNHHPAFFYCRHNHPLFSLKSIEPSAIAQYPLIRIELPRRITDMLDNLFFSNNKAGAAKHLESQVVSSDQAFIKSAVANSNAIGIGTFGTLETELNAGIFAPLPFRIKGLRTSYDIVKRKSLSNSPSARIFMELLIKIDSEQSRLETSLVNTLGAELTI